MTRQPLPHALAAALCLAAGAAQAVTCQNSIPASNPDAIYTVHGDGTVTDTRTGLMWKQCQEGYAGAGCTLDGGTTRFDWQAALAHAESHSFAGHGDWRLPNLKELDSLVEECRTNPAINNNVFPMSKDGQGQFTWYVWSSTPSALSNYAYDVDFDAGSSHSGWRDTAGSYVRLVRGGASSPSLGAVALSGQPTASAATVVGTSSLAAMGYWLVVPRGSAEPTPAQVKAQAGYGNVMPVAQGSAGMAAKTSARFAIATGLAAGTDYDFYLAADAAGKLSAAVQKVPFRTASVQPPNTHTVTATAMPVAGGSVTCSSPVNHGATATCNATAHTGYQFGGWTGACVGQGAACSLPGVTADQATVALFSQQYTGVTLPPGAPQPGQPLGLALLAGNGWQFAQASTQSVASLANAPALPAGVTLPYGLVSLRLESGSPGSEATVVLTYPQPLPPGARYYKYGKTRDDGSAHWYPFPGAVIAGNTVTLTLKDGWAGDDDLQEDGVIRDPGGVAVLAPTPAPAGATAIPTLGEWALALLGGLLGLFSLGALRRRG